MKKLKLLSTVFALAMITAPIQETASSNNADILDCSYENYSQSVNYIYTCNHDHYTDLSTKQELTMHNHNSYMDDVLFIYDLIVGDDNLLTMNNDHTHTPSMSWSSNSSSHWKICTVMGCSAQSSVGAHSYGTSTVCTTCGYTHTHTYSSSWSSNSSSHWKACTVAGCTATSSTGSHIYGTGTNCTTCNYSHTHSYGAWSYHSITQHKRSCTVSGCSSVEYANHVSSSVWSINSTHHWKACTASGCSHQFSYGTHTYGNSTACSSGCGQVHVHSYGSTWSNNEQQHWKMCVVSGCSNISNVENHTWAPFMNLRRCSICGFVSTI